jgi:hypothetical protein
VTLFERIAYAKQVWETFLSAVPAPDQKTLAYWSADYSTTEIDFAVSRTGKKFHGNPRMGTDELHGYCSGVLRNERTAPQRKTAPTTGAPQVAPQEGGVAA